MTTPSDIIQLALRASGVVGQGQIASAADMNDAFNLCNWMLDQWQRQRWLIWHLVDTALTSTGALSYSVGTGGDFSMFRPDKIEAAFARNLLNTAPNQVDYPLSQIEAREDYNRIALKTLGTFPQRYFYDSDYPLGHVYFWPVPQANVYEMHLTTKAVLSQFANLASTITLPPEYYAAIFWNLAEQIRLINPTSDPGAVAIYQGIQQKAKNALNVIRNANTQIPLLQMPYAVLPRGSRSYNIFNDQV